MGIKKEGEPLEGSVSKASKVAPDARQSEITKLWCEVLWKDKYGLVYPWKGRDAALLKQLLSWADKNYGEKAVEEITYGLKRYLDDESSFYASDRHLFSQFAAKPQKWLAVTKQAQPKAKAKEPEVKKPVVPLDEARVYTTIVSGGPEKMFKGWIKFTGPIMKISNPTLYDMYKRSFIDILGREMCLKIYRESHLSPIVSTSPSPSPQEPTRVL